MFWSMAGGADDRAPHSDFWYGPVGTPTASGQRVTADRSLALPAVYAAVKVHTDALKQIPLILYRRLSNGGKERAVDHPLYSVLHDAPNDNQTSPEWREVMHHHVQLRGNAYSEIVSDSRENPVQLEMPVHPDRVTAQKVRTSAGPRYRYVVQEDSGGARIVPADRMLHIRGLAVGGDGITGMSPIDMEREAVGAGLAAQDFVARFFANDARPGGWIEHGGSFKTDEDRQRFKRDWKAAYGGANRHSTAVLEFGMKYTPLEVKLVDAQFLEQRKYTNIDVARIFRVPPHMIMELDRATFSNITQQSVEFVKFYMMPWIRQWEARLTMSLLNEAERRDYFFEFLVDGLERGDPAARAAYYNRGIQDGWMTRNEVRTRENLDPLEGLDEPLEPLNMTNPGGRNDEQADALRVNAAEALARKHANEIAAMSPEDAAAFIANDWQRVARFMACRDEHAQQYCLELAERISVTRSMPAIVDRWVSQEVERLKELR
jgi:HK97 family phage portal protein